MERRGVTPIIATVLLIGIVIVVALIISVWIFGFLGESVVKNNRAIELSCDDVSFEADMSQSDLAIANRGTVPIFGFDVKKLGRADVLVNEVTGNTIGSGDTHAITLSDHGVFPEIGETFKVVPVLLGETSSDQQVAFTCPDESGKEVTVS